MPRLIISQPEHEEEQQIEIFEECQIGRDVANNLTLDDAGISRHHAKIVSAENNYYLIDLESGNGTLLNGVPVSPNEKTLLRDNDLISITNYHLRFSTSENGEKKEKKNKDETTDTDVLEIKLLKKVLDAIDKETVPSLEVLNGTSEGRKIFLTSDTEEITICRDPNCDFPINEHVISRQHSKIVKRWGGVTLRDLDSKNGTLVNNKRIVEEHLHDGDRVALGTIVFLYRNPQEINLTELGREISKKKKKKAPLPPKKEVQQKEAMPSDEELEKSLSRSAYPAPKPAQRLSPLEIGLIG